MVALHDDPADTYTKPSAYATEVVEWTSPSVPGADVPVRTSAMRRIVEARAPPMYGIAQT
jgi:hypothetical protein